MSENTQRHSIVLIENYWVGYFQSIAWLALLALAMGFGVWIESTAMQWVMTVFWMVSLIGTISGQAKRLTIDQAYARISEMKAEQDDASDEAAA